MLKRIFIIFSFALLSFSLSSGAQIVLPPVSGPIIEKLPIVVTNLTSVGAADQKADEFIDVFVNDLRNAALFEVSTGNISGTGSDNINFQSLSTSGAEYLVTGQYQSTGSRIKFAVRLFDVKDGKPILGRSYEASSGRVREAAHRFANQVMKELTGIDGFFTSKIAFVLGSKRNRNLFLMDYDGFNIRQLTKHSSLMMSPHCSPNGQMIVFNSDKVWDQDLYLITLGGKVTEKRLTRAFKLEQSPEWSPSGGQIAFSANGDIYVASASGKGARNLTRSRSIDVSPTWSPDGSKIAFVSDRSGSPQIYVMSLGGGGAKRITSGGYSTDPSWSPSSEVNRIAFVKVEGSGANIYTVDPFGGSEQRLTSGAGRNENPSWSPDGHYIAFSSTRDAAKNIYLMYLNGENQKRLSKGGGKSFPTWCK